MKFTSFFTTALLSSSLASAASLPHEANEVSSHLEPRAPRNVWRPETINIGDFSSLEKRKGGGGRSGGGSSSSGSSGSSSGSSGSSGSSSGGRSGSSGSSSGSSGSPRSSSSYGGAYGGGATTPYRAGASRAGITPFLLPIAGLGFLGVAALGAGAYLYDYPNRYSYYNQTSNQNATNVPVKCFCTDSDADCSCEPRNDPNYINALVGNGSWAAMQQNGVFRADNGTLYINGTVDAANDGAGDTSAASGRQSLAEASGWWLAIALVAATVWTGAA